MPASTLQEGVQFLETYLTEKTSDVSKLVSTNSTSGKEDKLSRLTNDLKNKNLTQIKTTIGTNPIVGMGSDTLNEFATKTVQQFIKNSLQKVNLNPVQNAVQTVFTTLAAASTLNTEVGLELTRNIARNIVKTSRDKRALITLIEKDLKAVHNACLLIINSTPFIDEYIRQLISAYRLLISSKTKFDDVNDRLKRGQPYRTERFNEGLRDLAQARDLILPDRGIDVSTITAVEDYAGQVLQRTTNKQAIAAAVSIPGIMLRLGRYAIEYTRLTALMNLYLGQFSSAFADLIEGFQRSKNITQATIDHITAGLSQLNSLILEMQPALFPDTAKNPDINVASPIYSAQISAAATGWGIKATAIYEWMALNPGVAVARIDKVSNTVLAYARAKETLDKLPAIKVGTIDYGMAKGIENPRSFEESFLQLTVFIYKIVGQTEGSRTNVTARFRTLNNRLDATKTNLSRIESALGSFIGTRNALSDDAARVVQNAVGIADKYGLDRIAALLKSGDIVAFLKTTPETATYAGAAVAGINAVIAQVKKNPNTDENQVQRLEDTRDQVAREQKTKDVEANRAYAATLEAAKTELNKQVARIKELVAPAIEAAKTIEKEIGESDGSRTQRLVSDAIPGFSANNTAGEV